MFSSPEKPPPAAEEPPPADDTEKPPPPPPGNADDKPPPPSQAAFDLLKTKCEELDAALLTSKKQVAEQQGVAENDAEAMTQMKTALAEAEGKSASVAEESATQMAAVTAEFKEAETKLAQMQAAEDSAEHRVKALEKQLEAATVDQATLAKQSEDVTELQATVRALQAAVDTHQTHVQSLEEALSNEKVAAAALKADIKTHAHDKAVVEKQHTADQSSLRRLKTEQTASLDEKKAMTVRLAQLETEIAHLKHAQCCTVQ